MKTFVLRVNGSPREARAKDDTPLLWVLREERGLTGTKFGCGVASCGACTVHVGGQPVRSCVFPVSAVAEQPVTTIEGLGTGNLHALQRAWIDEQVPQCGYCQSGMLMAAAALLKDEPKPSARDIDERITHLCRCGMYSRIKRAILKAAGQTA
jgi:isoquinoline 1-oxidoreductase alpha subunit